MSTTVLPFKNTTTSFFFPKRVLIVSKQSKLEYELNRLKTNYKREHFENIDDIDFLRKLEKQDTLINELQKRHNQQQLYVNDICNELMKHKIKYDVVTRQTYTTDLAKLSDLIISAGGDGTFLFAASKVKTDIPVIGINTDPIGSEGHLCLTGKLNCAVSKVLQQFLNNKFKWTYRQRIRVSVLKSENYNFLTTASSSISLLQQNNEKKIKTNLLDESYIYNNLNCILSSDKTQNFKFNSDDEAEVNDDEKHRLALNEVFIGESHAARVSYYDVQLDDGPLIKQKSSGMTICTGTGSTSWHYNINRLTEQNFCEILQVAKTMGFLLKNENGKENPTQIDESIVEELCKRFNERLIFEPSAKKMAFSIRDPVFNATFPKTPSRGFAQKIRLKSRCTHAHLIMDGSTSIPFNNGTEVLLEIHPEDALRTAVLL